MSVWKLISAGTSRNILKYLESRQLPFIYCEGKTGSSWRRVEVSDGIHGKYDYSTSSWPSQMHFSNAGVTYKLSNHVLQTTTELCIPDME